MSAEALALVIAGQMLVAATPLLVAGLGELVAERTGVLNIGIEGLMLTGCIAGFATAAATGSGWLGVGAAIVAAMAVGALFAVLAINARTDQIVAGMAVNLAAFGLSGTVWQILQERSLTDLPAGAGFGRGLFGQYPLTWIALCAAFALALVFARTRLGLMILALGEDPAAAAAAGIPVRRARWLAILFAAGCAGAAGAFLSLMRTHAFVPHMTGGQGFVVLALVMFGRWRVGWMVAGCLLFGLADSVQQQMQSLDGARRIPYQAFLMLPYIVALIALGVASRSAPGPSALGRPWP